MSAQHCGRVYLLAFLFIVVSGIGGCDTADLTQSLGAIQGSVKTADGKPLSSAAVQIEGTSIATLSNGDGRYVLNMPAGHYTATATKAGYRSLSLQTDIGTKSIETQLDFTLLPTRTAPTFKLNVAIDGARFEIGDIVPLTLTVGNEANDPTTIGGFGFFAQDERGNVLWRHQRRLDGETLAPGETAVFTHRWLPAQTTTAPIVLGGTIACYGVIYDEDGTEVISSAVSVEIVDRESVEERIDFETVARGKDSAFRERLALVIRDEETWREFWQHHGSLEELPRIDFSRSMIIAALGGNASADVSLEIVKLAETPRYRQDSAEETVASALTCTVRQEFTPTGRPADGTEARPALLSPYHLVTTAARPERVEFCWQATADGQ